MHRRVQSELSGSAAVFEIASDFSSVSDGSGSPRESARAWSTVFFGCWMTSNDDYLREAMTATCPSCSYTVDFGGLMVRPDGVFEVSHES